MLVSFLAMLVGDLGVLLRFIMSPMLVMMSSLPMVMRRALVMRGGVLMMLCRRMLGHGVFLQT